MLHLLLFAHTSAVYIYSRTRISYIQKLNQTKPKKNEIVYVPFPPTNIKSFVTFAA